MLKIVSPLPEELETMAHEVIGCCVAVHKELGPGLLESVYPRAVAIELEACWSTLTCRSWSKESGVSFC